MEMFAKFAAMIAALIGLAFWIGLAIGVWLTVSYLVVQARREDQFED